MTMKLNRSAYDQLVSQDIAWLEQQPISLERNHIREIVQKSSVLYYDAEELARSVLGALAREYPDIDQMYRLAKKILSVTAVEPR
jgi:hypothetical protein